MTATHSVVLYDPKDTSAEVQAAAGFLAGYSGRTREAYTLDMRQFYGWCDRHHLELFEVTRTHIELYARELEELGRAQATIGRRLSTSRAATCGARTPRASATGVSVRSDSRGRRPDKTRRLCGSRMCSSAARSLIAPTWSTARRRVCWSENAEMEGEGQLPSPAPDVDSTVGHCGQVGRWDWSAGM
ncbi:MAG: site-specific integrase [Actinobacteria bacterium]|nr:site-specific integrase [Actinomycetota bacterium]